MQIRYVRDVSPSGNIYHEMLFYTNGKVGSFRATENKVWAAIINNDDSTLVHSAIKDNFHGCFAAGLLMGHMGIKPDIADVFYLISEFDAWRASGFNKTAHDNPIGSGKTE